MNALYIVSGLGIISLIAEIFSLQKFLLAVVVLGLIAAAVLITFDWNTSQYYFQSMIVFDNTALAFSALMIVTSLVWLGISGTFFTNEENISDRMALVLFTLVGGIVMASFNNMSMLFLGIEILSVALYVLAGSRKDIFSTEAAFKYLLMGSFATGFLLFGIALIYGATGLFHINLIADYVNTHTAELPSFFYVGVLLMLIGLAFKISAVPFHFWAPDVYTGSPSPITAFMSTVVKIAAIAAFIRIFSTCFIAVSGTWITVLQVITILTLIIPNVTAVYQTNVKRLLAYSSVGHVGYILLAFIADPASASGTIFFYLTAYAAASIASFSVLIILEKDDNEVTISDFNGLFKRNTALAVTMTVALLSLAGIPPLAGFFGKYLVFAQAISHGYIGLVVVAVLTSLIGVYYYFKVIIAMFLPSDGSAIEITSAQRVLLILLIILSFALTIFPDKLISLI